MGLIETAKFSNGFNSYLTFGDRETLFIYALACRHSGGRGILVSRRAGEILGEAETEGKL